MVSLPIVLLIFITSNSPQGKLNEELVTPPTAQPEIRFVDSDKSLKDSPTQVNQVNDLTVSDFKFPDEHSRGKVIVNKKIIREKIVPDEKDEKDKVPVPLYSLVKNECGEGYALDENGVCQKTITARSGKNFDSDRRRKRHALDSDWIVERKKKEIQNSEKDDIRQISLEKSKLYRAMLPNRSRASKKPLDKALPP